MPEIEALEYYRSRERREREMAEIATDPAVAYVHLEMAGIYAKRLATERHSYRGDTSSAATNQR